MKENKPVTNEAKGNFEGMSFSEALYSFMVIFSISVRAMNFLLLILKVFAVPNAPKNFYNLKKNSRRLVNSYKVDDKECTYLSIKSNLEYLVEKEAFPTGTEVDVKLKFNIDGLPLYRSSKISAWPFLMQVVSNVCTFKKPLPIALYVGKGKPLLKPLVQKLSTELRSLMSSNFSYRNVVVNIKDVLFVCDAPARAQLMEVKSHSGYNACHICDIKGQYLNGSVSFPRETNCRKRLWSKYKRGEENNQLAISPLTTICDFSSSFPPEYMHSVLLGTFKKFLSFLLFSKKDKRFSCKLRSCDVDHLNREITSIRKFVPHEFQRKIRPFSDFEFFKATEFRQFLLYYCPYLFKGIVSPDVYESLICLHFAIFSLCSERSCDLLDVSLYCLNQFAILNEKLFGPQNQTYNSHMMHHLPEFIERYGTLDSFSSFPFESYLSIVKKRTKATNCIFQQTVKNLLNIRNICSDFENNDLILTTQCPNNCVLISGKVVLIDRVIQKNIISGKVLTFLRNLYTSPYPSSAHLIGFYKLSNEMVFEEVVDRKCICIVLDNEYLVFPFCSATLGI